MKWLLDLFYPPRKQMQPENVYSDTPKGDGYWNHVPPAMQAMRKTPLLDQWMQKERDIGHDFSSKWTPNQMKTLELIFQLAPREEIDKFHGNVIDRELNDMLFGNAVRKNDRNIRDRNMTPGTWDRQPGVGGLGRFM